MKTAILSRALLLAALGSSLLTACNDQPATTTETTAPDTSAAPAPADTTTTAAAPTMQDTVFAELTTGAVAVRSAEGRHEYVLGENTLFEGSTTTLLPDAPTKLTQIAASINRRFPRQHVRLFSVDGPATKLSAQRMAVVRDWLLQNARIDAALEELPRPADAAINKAGDLGIAVNP